MGVSANPEDIFADTAALVFSAPELESGWGIGLRHPKQLGTSRMVARASF
jgi:hypothetical protein